MKKGINISHVNMENMGGRDQSQVKIKFKKFEKIKSVPKTYQKVITMTSIVGGGGGGREKRDGEEENSRRRKSDCNNLIYWKRDTSIHITMQHLLISITTANDFRVVYI